MVLPVGGRHVADLEVDGESFSSSSQMFLTAAPAGIIGYDGAGVTLI